MTESQLLAPFDEEVVRAVADANNVEYERLREAVADHQRTMRENPGVEDLVYEWRKQYDDPVLFRSAETFIVGLPPTVWEDYGSYLGLDDYVLAALSAVHQEQTIRTEDVDLTALAEGYVPLVVGREPTQRD
ncbi:hypothetical protein [Haloarcula marina]|uniref:hypothetical protein n=1 Tax=Haloarcula marina TaxID=2961574 RepID=UPI0020B72A6C|nr:hypothetical protein [Halomicroarcula marina]